MNNSGQVLVIFIVAIPVIALMIGAFAYLGKLQQQNQIIGSNVRIAIDYGLNHLEDADVKDKITNILQKNKTDNFIVEINDNVIKIVIKKETGDITYLGYKEGDKKIIKEMQNGN